VNKDTQIVGAVILAAGQSRRMGQPKLVLPWGNKTVIEHVLDELMMAGVFPIVVVTGGSREKVGKILENYPVTLCLNPDYQISEMLESLKIGLYGMPSEPDACLVVLGDQPQIKRENVELVLSEYQSGNHRLVIPSFHMKRGHPWLVGREFWPIICGYKNPQTLRNFLSDHASLIHYVNIDDRSILMDLDTPEDYIRERPKNI
jgi:molybdenum cofactor cytidylyltransferase